LGSFSNSLSYFEFSVPVFGLKQAQSNSIRGRFFCILAVLGFIFLLPLVLISKFAKTLFRGAGVILGLAFFLLTMGVSVSMRNFFIRRVNALISDLVDWVLFPFATLTYCCRLLLGSLIRPSFFLPI